MSINQLERRRNKFLHVNCFFVRRSLPNFVLLLMTVHLFMVSAVTKAETSIYEPGGLVAELFGINEALSFPEKFERSGNVDLARLRKRLERQGIAALNVGAQWTRGHTVAFPLLSWDRWEREYHSFQRADIWIRAVQSVETNSSAADPSFDNADIDINQILENALKHVSLIEELANTCEAELREDNNSSSSTFKTGGACSCFQSVSNRFEFARVRLTIALIALSWDELSKVLESWALRREDLKSLDAAHERIQTLEQLLSQSDDNTPVTK